MTDSPHPSARPSKAQRRLLTAVAGLAVTALAAAAFVLTYDDLRALARHGDAPARYAPLYPGMLDGLVVVAVLAVLMARRSGWWTRTLRWLLLLALVTGAGAAGVQRAVRGYGGLPHAWVEGGVAVAPWAILLIAVWLWVGMIKQARRMLTGRGEPPAPPESEETARTTADEAFIPGLDDEPADVTRPIARPAPPLAPALDAAAPTPETQATPAPRPEPATPAAAPEPAPGTAPVPAPALLHDHAVQPTAATDDAPAIDPAPAPALTSAPTVEAVSARRAEPTATTDHDGAEETVAEPEAEDEDNVESDEHAKAPQPPPEDESTDEATTEPMVRDSLPTDVVVARPPRRTPATLPDGFRVPPTQPDGIGLKDTRPDGIPIVTANRSGEVDPPTAGRAARDADADDESPGATPPSGAGGRSPETPGDPGRPVAGPTEGRAESGDADDLGPPSSTFRSSPTPPRD